MLGLFLTIGLFTIPAFAETETILSPHQQFQNGIPLEQITFFYKFTIKT